MEDLKFELGQWVEASGGYGQIIYIRPFFVEDYEINRKGRKNGEFIRFIYICKILCDFDGKIKKTNRFSVNTSIHPISKEGKLFVKSIKFEQIEEYQKYILYDQKNSIKGELFLNYRLDTIDFDLDFIENQFYDLISNLNFGFTYKEFANLFKKYNFPFKLENLDGYALSDTLDGSKIMLRFDSQLYKTKDKEAIFDYARIFFPKSLEK